MFPATSFERVGPGVYRLRTRVSAHRFEFPFHDRRSYPPPDLTRDGLLVRWRDVPDRGRVALGPA